MAVNDSTASSRQLLAHCYTTTAVLMTSLSIHRRLKHRKMREKMPLNRIPFTANHRRLRLQWAPEHRAWQDDWYRVVFSDETRINLSDHDERVHVRHYAGQRCFQRTLSNDIVAEHPELWPEVQFRVMDDRICYKLRVISLATSTCVKCYSPKSFPFFKVSLELSFSRIMHAHVLQRLFETSV